MSGSEGPRGGEASTYKWRCSHCGKEVPGVTPDAKILCCPYCTRSPSEAAEETHCSTCGEQQPCKCPVKEVVPEVLVLDSSLPGSSKDKPVCVEEDAGQAVPEKTQKRPRKADSKESSPDQPPAKRVPNQDEDHSVDQKAAVEKLGADVHKDGVASAHARLKADSRSHSSSSAHSADVDMGSCIKLEPKTEMALVEQQDSKKLTRKSIEETRKEAELVGLSASQEPGSGCSDEKSGAAKSEYDSEKKDTQDPTTATPDTDNERDTEHIVSV